MKMSMNHGAAYWSRITGTPRPHRGTLIRWAVKGCRGKRLRAESLAGRWYTTEADIDEFLRHVTMLPADADDRTAGPARAAQVQRALDDLDRVIAPKQPGRRPQAKGGLPAWMPHTTSRDERTPGGEVPTGGSRL